MCGTPASPAKPAEPIEMVFGRQSRVGPRNHADKGQRNRSRQQPRADPAVPLARTHHRPARRVGPSSRASGFPAVADSLEEGRHVVRRCAARAHLQPCLHRHATLQSTRAAALNFIIIIIARVRRHTIDRPHPISCQCADCVTKQNYDSLKRSRSRLNAYRALASPAYMALSTDPRDAAVSPHARVVRLHDLTWRCRAPTRS